MKTLFTIAFLFCFAGLAWGQDSTDVLQRVKELLEEKSGKTEIGRIAMRDFALVFERGTEIGGLNEIAGLIKQVDAPDTKTLPHLFGEKSGIAKVVYIDSVKLQINEGLIEFIKVYGSDGSTFYNKYAPVPLLSIENRFEDRLFNPNDGSFILLKNAVSFDTNSRFNFFPNDQTFTLSKASQSLKTLYANNGVNSFVNLQVYSDLLALLGNEPNGLLQFEASARFYLHRKNFYRFTYIFYAVEPFFRFNRLDSKFDTLAVADNDSLINRTRLFRRSNFSTGVSLGVLRWDWRPANSLELNTGYLYNSSNTVINEVETTGVFHTFYGELSFSSKRLNNFGMELSGRYIRRKLNANEQFKNSGWYSLSAFSGSIFYFPTERSEENKIVLRFTNYLNWGDRTLDYSSLQIGYRTSLNF